MSCLHGAGLHVVRDSVSGGGEDSAALPVYDVYGLSGVLGRLDPTAVRIDAGNGRITLPTGLESLIKPVRLAHSERGGTGTPATWYDRIVPKNPEQDFQAMLTLGKIMKVPPGPGEQRVRAQSGVPVAYTYLGQFIAHDLSKMVCRSPGASVENWRTAALDLDSVFWREGESPIWPADTCPMGGIAVGRTAEDGPGRWDDLPRQDGRALIPDHRNDLNVAVAQTHVLLSKFHHVVVAAFRGSDADHRDITRQHVHAVVLHDLLPRICDWEVYADVLAQGRAVIAQGRANGDYLLPLEFAAACYRFGHSMVRDLYPRWGSDDATGADLSASPGQLVANTYPGDGLDGGRLKDGWRNRWENLLNRGCCHSREPMFAAPIDTVVSRYLHAFDPWLLPTDETPLPVDSIDARNLALRTLVRGHTLELATGEECAEFLRARLGPGRPAVYPLGSGEVRAAAHQPVRDFLANHPVARPLEGRTPLWLYVLCEAVHHHRGQRLGPVGSRFVVESVHAAIEAAPNSIVRGNRCLPFTPAAELRTRAGTCWQLRDIVDCVARKWRPSTVTT